MKKIWKVLVILAAIIAAGVYYYVIRAKGADGKIYAAAGGRLITGKKGSGTESTGAIPSGALIEQSGLKGYSVGGACVSEKHAGFVVNKGNATANDVIKLIEHIKQTVKNDSGVELECEIKFV